MIYSQSGVDVTYSYIMGILGPPAISADPVKVTAKDNKNVTISFNNAKFEDMMGTASFTVNGTITLPID